MLLKSEAILLLGLVSLCPQWHFDAFMGMIGSLEFSYCMEVPKVWCLIIPTSIFDKNGSGIT